MFNCLRYACAIPDPDNDEVIITGGEYSPKIVSVYNKNGWQRDMPSLENNRLSHACTSFVQSGRYKEEQIFSLFIFNYFF